MIEAWYFDIPPVTRTYVTLCFATTTACALEIISPLTLYFNARAISTRMQLWRLATNFLYFGPFGLDFLFHMFFLVRYSRLLEEGSFRMRTADFLFMLLFGASVMTLIAPFINIQFFGSSLTFMMVYVWGRRNDSVRMSFLGLFHFTAPYLPWVLLAFSVLIGNTYIVDTIGIAVGHVYYFLEDIYPLMPAASGRRAPRPPHALARIRASPRLTALPPALPRAPLEQAPAQDPESARSPVRICDQRPAARLRRCVPGGRRRRCERGKRPGAERARTPARAQGGVVTVHTADPVMHITVYDSDTEPGITGSGHRACRLHAAPEISALSVTLRTASRAGLTGAEAAAPVQPLACRS